MKPSTLAIAFGPAVLVLAARFAIQPTWLNAWSTAECLALGAVIGVLGAIAASTWQPREETP